MCKFFELLYSCLPFVSVRDRLIRRHFDACPKCREKYDCNLVFSSEEKGETVPPLWPGIEKRIRACAADVQLPHKPLPVLAIWGYAAALAVIVFLAVGFSFFRPAVQPPFPARQEAEPRFALLSARIGEADARTYIFRPENSRLVIVFFKKS